MKVQREEGSAHVVIIVILVVALIAALGFIFWQNLNKDKYMTTHVTKTETASDKKTDATRKEESEFQSKLFKGLTLTPVDAWTVSEPSNASKNIKIVLSKPGAKLTLNFNKAPETYGVEGYTCDKVASLERIKEGFYHYNDADGKLVFVAAVGSKDTEWSNANSEAESRLDKNPNLCELSLSSIIGTYVGADKEVYWMTITSYGSYSKSDLSEIDAMLKTLSVYQRL